MIGELPKMNWLGKASQKGHGWAGWWMTAIWARTLWTCQGLALTTAFPMPMRFKDTRTKKQNRRLYRPSFILCGISHQTHCRAQVLPKVYWGEGPRLGSGPSIQQPCNLAKLLFPLGFPLAAFPGKRNLQADSFPYISPLDPHHILWHRRYLISIWGE